MVMPTPTVNRSCLPRPHRTVSLLAGPKGHLGVHKLCFSHCGRLYEVQYGHWAL